MANQTERETMLALAKQVERHIGRLAATRMEMSLIDWGVICSDLHGAASALRLAATPPAVMSSEVMLEYDERVEMLRLADDIAGGEIAEFDQPQSDILVTALRLAATPPAAGSEALRDQAFKTAEILETSGVELDVPYRSFLARQLRTALSAAQSETGGEAINKAADEVVSRVVEWDDRTSPEDFPEALLITPSELHRELVRFAQELHSSQPETASNVRESGSEA